MEAPDFRELFRELTGVEPYGWQVRAGAALAAGAPPDELSAPTGTGKTLLQACWLYGAVVDAARMLAGERRRVPRRYVVVVDRRVVVDDTFATAQRLAHRLNTAETPAIVSARGLLRFAYVPHDPGDEGVLDVVLLRGGMGERPENTRHPARPTIIVGTVDLIGSRLLGRGYGITPERRPIEMALIATDSLIVLDEAHLSRQLAATLWVLGGQAAGESGLDGRTPPRQILTMTATPTGVGTFFDLDEEVRRSPEFAERRRRRRATPVRIVDAQKVSADKGVAQVVKTMPMPRGNSTIIYLNTRTEATKVGQLLARRRDLRAERVVMLVGGMPERLVAKVVEEDLASLRSNAPRLAADDNPLVLVSTQASEVGADLDADHLVTACPSRSPLRQRLGRVNRLGLRDGGSVTIVVTSRPGSAGEPVYGDAALVLGRALLEAQPSTLGELDDFLDSVGSEDWDVPAPEPALLPRHIFEAYQRTAGSPHEPPVGRWLRAPEDPLGEVSVAFRMSMLEVTNDFAVANHLMRCPPTPDELWTVPVGTGRSLLKEAHRAAVFPSGRRQVLPTLDLDPAGLTAGDVIVLPSGKDVLHVPGSGADLTGVGDGATFWLVKEEELNKVENALLTMRTPLLDEQGMETGWVELRPLRGAEDDSPAVPYPLAEHLEDVRDRVQELASALDLSAAITDDIALAALMHDRGKSEDPFQQALCHRLDDAGALLWEPHPEAVGKSALPRRLWATASRLAGVPAGLRHEAVSAHIFDAELERGLIRPHDAELVRHLILSHHGRFRGHAPLVADSTRTITPYQDASAREWATRPDEFERLLRRYGPYSLALAETVLRLADWDASRRLA